MKALVATALAIGMLALGVRTLVAQSGNDLFQQALVKERTEGNPTAAIALYQTIVDKHRTDRALVAKALVQMGQCFEKLGQSDAIEVYERVVREFDDQKASVTIARARLTVLQPPAGVRDDRIWNDVDELEYGPIGISADGRYTSFTDSSTLALVVRDLKTGLSRNLTSHKDSVAAGSVDYAARSLVSPDGRHVAYSWEVSRGEFEDTYDLRILSLGDSPGAPRIVHQSKETRKLWPAAWTPDGKSLVVVRRVQDRTWQIGLVSIADKSLRSLKSLDWREPGKMSLSPDGKTLAYDVPVDRGVAARDILLLAMDGSRETVAVQNAADDEQPVWSPDGSRLLFVSNRTGKDSLWTIEIDAGKAFGSPELVSPDIGRLVGITRAGGLYHITGGQGTSNIYAVDVDANMKATGPPVLATGRLMNSNSTPRLSHDGRHLAYTRNGPLGGIVVRLLTTGAERELHSGLPQMTRLVGWFPDGHSLLVSCRETIGGSFHRIDIASGAVELVLRAETTVRASDLSPDGKALVYIGTSNTSLPILIRFDMEQRVQKTLLEDAGLAEIASIAISPDSAQLAFMGGAGGLNVMPVDGGERRRIFQAAGRRSSTLAWTPGQRYFLFTTDSADFGKVPVYGGRDNVQELWRVAVTGDEAERLGISVRGGLSSPVLDSRSRRIFYQATETPRSELWALENFLPKASAKK